MRKTTVTIGIPTYQSELNIAPLLKSLLEQRQRNIKIEKILVYSDGSTDNTVKEARSIKSKKIQVINSKKNRGFAYALQYLLSRNKSEVFVELNDDIKINSDSVIEELIKPFKNKAVGLVGGNIQALQPKTFIGRCIYTSYLVFLPLRGNIKRGETDLTCDGKIVALSRDFAKTLDLRRIDVGNVDIYLFYENLRQNRLYKFAKKAVILYRIPETIDDFKNQELRARASRNLMKKHFQSLFLDNHKISRLDYLKSATSVFLKYPLKSLIFKMIINRYFMSTRQSFQKWRLALTTKKLSILFMDLESLRNTL